MPGGDYKPLQHIACSTVLPLEQVKALRKCPVTAALMGATAATRRRGSALPPHSVAGSVDERTWDTSVLGWSEVDVTKSFALFHDSSLVVAVLRGAISGIGHLKSAAAFETSKAPCDRYVWSKGCGSSGYLHSANGLRALLDPNSTTARLYFGNNICTSLFFCVLTLHVTSHC